MVKGLSDFDFNKFVWSLKEKQMQSVQSCWMFLSYDVKEGLLAYFILYTT